MLLKGNLIPNALIAGGTTTLLITAMMTFGFNSMVRTMVPMSLRNFPLNESHQVWIKLPLEMAIQVRVTNATASDELADGILGSGQVTFRLKMKSWVDGEKELVPVLYVEEENGIGSTQRYLLVFMDGPVNFAKFYSVSFGLIALSVGTLGAVLWYRTKH